jgi:hypothetical protein
LDAKHFPGLLGADLVKFSTLGSLTGGGNPIAALPMTGLEGKFAILPSQAGGRLGRSKLFFNVAESLTTLGLKSLGA